MSPGVHEYRPTRVVAGILFLCIGLGFLLDSFHVWTVQIVDVWPLFLVAFGTAVLMSRAKRAKVEEDRSAQLAVAEERVRIARELHDIVAHGVSLMTIQIAAARRAQKSQPDAAEESLKAAEETGRQSLAELQGMLSMLRGADASIGAAGSRAREEVPTAAGAGGWARPGPWQPSRRPSRVDEAAAAAEKALAWANWAADRASEWAVNRKWQGRWDHGHWQPPGPPGRGPRPAPATAPPAAPGAGAARSPLPRLADVDHLVSSLRSAGLEIETTVVGVPPALSPGAELAIYRVVQEGLTNAMRYAPKSHVQLEITYAPDHVLIYVDDDGPGAPAGKATSGHGLVGMQERIAAVGGTLTVGPRDPGPGWRVHARIPVAGFLG